MNNTYLNVMDVDCLRNLTIYKNNPKPLPAWIFLVYPSKEKEINNLLKLAEEELELTRNLSEETLYNIEASYPKNSEEQPELKFISKPVDLYLAQLTSWENN